MFFRLIKIVEFTSMGGLPKDTDGMIRNRMVLGLHSEKIREMQGDRLPSHRRTKFSPRLMIFRQGTRQERSYAAVWKATWKPGQMHRSRPDMP